MAQTPYVAVLQVGSAHIAYGAALLDPLPDLLGAGPAQTAPLAKKEEWLKEHLHLHDAFVAAVLRTPGLRSLGLRVWLRPGAPQPLTVAYVLGASAREENDAADRLRTLWRRFSSAAPSGYFPLKAVTTREEFDRLLDLRGLPCVTELRRPSASARLTDEHVVQHLMPFADVLSPWNRLAARALCAEEPLCVDALVSPTHAREEELAEIGQQVRLCRAVAKVIPSSPAGAVGALLGARQSALAEACALVRVTACAQGPLGGEVAAALSEVFPCASARLGEFAPASLIRPGDQEAALQTTQFMLPPTVSAGNGATDSRLPWLCALPEAAVVLRPPVLFGPRPPGVELSVPPALEDVLAGGEPVVVHTNAYFGKGAQVSAEHMAFSFHTEHVGGDKVAGDQIIAGDKVSAPAPGEAGDHAGGPKDAQGALGPVASRGPQPGPVRCGRCGHECPADARFCLRCGARLPGRCPSCARPAAPGDRFCTACGAALDPTPQ